MVRIIRPGKHKSPPSPRVQEQDTLLPSYFFYLNVM